MEHRIQALEIEKQELEKVGDQIKDENISLKMNVAQLETDLLDERESKKVKFEMNLDCVKAKLEEEMIQHKDLHSKELMTLKEANFRLKVELQSMVERNTILKEDLTNAKLRVGDLEKDNLLHCKENLALNSEIDYKNAKSQSLQ